MLNQCLESLVQKVQSGVVINFEKTGPDPLLIGEGIVDNFVYTLQCYWGEPSLIGKNIKLIIINGLHYPHAFKGLQTSIQRATICSFSIYACQVAKF